MPRSRYPRAALFFDGAFGCTDLVAGNVRATVGQWPGKGRAMVGQWSGNGPATFSVKIRPFFIYSSGV
eukprot:11187712-Lingulodinium_polyedra.AAC.1